MTLSIIISTYNDMSHGYIERICKEIAHIPETEIIVVDGGSTDKTIDCAKKYGAKVLVIPHSTRGKRLHIGAEHSTGHMLLFHHPRTIIPREAIEYLILRTEELSWGGFTHQFDTPSLLARYTSWYSNEIRTKKRGVVYLDHGIFVQTPLYRRSGGFPDFPIFEDTALSTRLRKLQSPILLPQKSVVSSIRFKKNGWLYQILLNQIMKVGYLFGISPKTLYKMYERGLWLN